MSSLNLLPLDKQRAVTRTKTLAAIAEFLLGSLLLVAGLGIVLLLGRLLLQSNLIKVVHDYNLLTSNQPPVNREVQNLNRLINQAIILQNNFWPVLPALTRLEKTLGEDILLKNMDLTKNQITIVAVAPNRDAALAWQDRLKKTPGWEQIILPLADLVHVPPLTITISLPRL